MPAFIRRIALWRVWPLMRKELVQVRRDRRTLAMIFVQPIISLTLLGYALNTDVKDMATAVYDQSHSPESRALVKAFSASGYFVVYEYAESYDDVRRLIDAGQVKAALVIPPDYAVSIQAGQKTAVQFFVDGADPSVAVPALSYASLIANDHSTELIAEALKGLSFALPIDFRPQILYNPDMDVTILRVPGLVGTVLQWISLALVALSIVREREQGTMEQLMVTPLRSMELMLGKMLPFVIISLADVTLALLVATLIFGMPMNGSVLLLYTLSIVFLIFSLGIGLFISTVAQTQDQAQQLMGAIILPTVLLSGFMFPLAAMPGPAQTFARFLPLTQFLIIVRGIVVKGVGMEALWSQTAILAAMGGVTLVISALRFQKRVA
ncbi:MAG: ABC transporter permease [Chloroflexi bacterium]|nr:ABC transporter permease [Chloroflexota bacterium]